MFSPPVGHFLDNWLQRFAEFGNAVALDGDTALVGAYGDSNENGNFAGAAYVFTHENGQWTQTQKLLADDGQRGDWFGYSVTLDGDTALIGQVEDDTNQDSIYVFTRQNGQWTQTQKLVADDQPVGFGGDVALDGDTAVIGAYGDDENGDFAGAAYVFTRENG